MKWSEIGLKDYYAGFALLVATILSFVGTFLPPAGEIHQSMLYLVAQFLLLCATLLGVGHIYKQIKESVKIGMKNKVIDDGELGLVGDGENGATRRSVEEDG